MDTNNHYELSDGLHKQGGGASPGRHQGSTGMLELCETSGMTYPGMPFTSKDTKFRGTDPRQYYSAHL